MPTLGDLAKLIRSKNAGPFELTFDIMFEDKENYERVKQSGRLSRELLAGLYGISVGDISLIEYDAANAIKVTIPRPCISGDIGDGDVFGGQQYGPLVEIEIP